MTLSQLILTYESWIVNMQNKMKTAHPHDKEVLEIRIRDYQGVITDLQNLIP